VRPTSQKPHHCCHRSTLITPNNLLPRLTHCSQPQPHSIFCSSCLVRHGVPHDEISLQEAPPAIVSALGSINVKCPFHNEGCDWTGPRSQIQSHVEHCSRVVYHCSYSHHGCTFSTGQVDDIVKHMLACEFKQKTKQTFPQSPASAVKKHTGGTSSPAVAHKTGKLTFSLSGTNQRNFGGC